MKKRLIGSTIFLIFVSSCVPKSDFEKLEKEKSNLTYQLEEMKQNLSDVTNKYDLLIEEKRRDEIEQNKKPYITEYRALQLIKDNYSFYEKNMVYRNVQLRRIADNSFKVSLETCINKESFRKNDFHWHSSVRTLTVHNNEKYDF